MRQLRQTIVLCGLGLFLSTALNLAADTEGKTYEYDSQYREACGAIAAFTACGYYDIPAKLEEMYSLTRTQREGGTNLLSIKMALEKKGLQCIGLKIDPRHLVALENRTFILPLRRLSKSYDHFTFGLNRFGFVVFCDFERHVHFPDLEELRDKWDGEILVVANKKIDKEQTLAQLEENFKKYADIIWVRGIPFVWVEPGKYTKPTGEKDEVPKGFYISRFEITALNFLRFAQETGYGIREDRQGADEPWVKDLRNLEKKDLFKPIVSVSLDTAEEFARWVASDVSVPTFGQWLLAYQNGQHYAYPWGDSQEKLEGFKQERRRFQIGSNTLDVTRHGIYDMFSNVREIVVGGQYDVPAFCDERDNPSHLQEVVILANANSDRLVPSKYPKYMFFANRKGRDRFTGFRVVLNRERSVQKVIAPAKGRVGRR